MEAEKNHANLPNDGGATWHTDQLIEDNAGHGADSPQVAVSGNNVVAVWRQADGNNLRIYSNFASFVQAPAAPTQVPTMTEWGMIVLIILAVLGAMYHLMIERKRTRETG